MVSVGYPVKQELSVSHGEVAHLSHTAGGVPHAVAFASTVTQDGIVAPADYGERQAGLMRRCCTRGSTPRSGFAGFRFPPEVIILVVRW
jgi:hypothetical protein